jgi:acetyl esterase
MTSTALEVKIGLPVGNITAVTLLELVPPGWQARLAHALFALPRPVRATLAGRPVWRAGQRLDPDLALLLRLARLRRTTLRGDTPIRARTALRDSAPIVAGPPIVEVGVTELTLDTPAAALPARLYTPAGSAEGGPLLLFFHGGGWVVGDLDTYDDCCRYLARQAGVRVLSVAYRLAPEHPFPAAVTDALAAFDWAVAHAAELGIDPAAVAVGGDSAGASLSAVVGQQTAARPGPRPAFALLFYPAVDATARRPSRDLFADGFFLTDADLNWFAEQYVPDPAQRADPRCSVLLAPDLTGFPPTYLVTAGFDPLRDEGEEFAAKLAAAGVPVVLRRHPDLIHGFLNFLGVGERSREAVAEAAGALRAGLVLRRSPTSR